MNTTSSTPGDARLHRLLGYLQHDPDNAALQADIFDMALEQGAFALAQERVDAALAAAPADPLWRHRHALLLIAQHRYAQAEAICDALEIEGHGGAVIGYNRAWIAFCEARYADARAILQALLDTPDAPAATLPLLLRCMHRQRALDEALALFGERAAHGRANDAAYGVASLIAIDADRIADAGPWAARALRSHPDQMEALVARGTVALAQQDWASATDCLQRAIELHPKDGRTWSALGMAYMLRMELASALRHLEQAVVYMPGHVGTWHAIAWCQLLQRDLGAAQRAFEQALELDRNFGESHGGLAVALAMQGRGDEARAAIERAQRLDPGNVSARYAEAVLSGEASQVERLARLAERVLGGRSTPDGVPLADIVLRRQRPSGA